MFFVIASHNQVEVSQDTSKRFFTALQMFSTVLLVAVAFVTECEACVEETSSL